MKLERIQLTNFLSHGSTDWEPNGTRLGAIVGPNGAGKSALLDGILYALYDAARAKTDQLVRLGSTDMSSTVEITYNGQRFRIVRGRTSKGAGKSFLEVHVRAEDGSWRPLTGDDIRATQAVIDDLLGLDAEAFVTSVFLRQGDADRFITATAGDRKRLLGTLLGLDVFARAEGRAREEARDLEARTVAERNQVERLEDAIAELEPATRIRDEARERIAELEASQVANRSARRALTTRLQELAVEIAKGDAATAEVARLEAERTTLADRYRREKAAVTASDEALARATAVVARAGAIEAAQAALEGARTEVTALEGAERAWRDLVDQTRAQREKVLGLEHDFERAYEPWRHRYVAAQERVTELVERGKSGASTCEACGQPIGRAQALEQLAAARAMVQEIEAQEPRQPLAIARESATHQRLEGKLREVTEPDARAMSAARFHLGDLERTAARAGEIAAARSAVEQATAAKASAEAELVVIAAAGAAIAARITEAVAATVGTARLLEEKAALEREARDVDASIEAAERGLRLAEGQLAAAVASLERREHLRGQREVLALALETADVELARLRRLVVAFGVTGIPARIIEGVLPELAGYANELLGELRPGMALELRAQRAKRDGKGVVEALDLVVRDDVGERPLALFSGGERMSVSLAIAVGLSRLVARRAGSAIRTLVVDEPDGLDADARRAFGQALRVLAHHGDLERVVLVSHHPDLAEYADTVWSVSKTGSGSVVIEAA